MLGVLGMGDIGTRVAEVGAAFGMTVWACRRGGGRGGGGGGEGETGATSASVPSSSPSFVSKTFGMGDEQLRSFLGGCDYVVNLLPSTPDTRGVLSASRLAWCKRAERGSSSSATAGGGGGGTESDAVTAGPSICS